jgi:predicted acetyltransferase
VSLRPASVADRPILRAFLDQYLEELSSFGDVDLAYPWFDAYWQPGEARWPYVIEDAHRDAVGFVLVNTHVPQGLSADFAIAEFFIAPAARGHGSGLQAAAATFRRHPGVWALAVLPRNAAALRFWPAAFAAAGATEIEQTAHPEEVWFRFRMKGGG